MKDKSFAEKSVDPVNKSVVVGLDIGTTKIACFVGVKNEHDKIEIISQGKSESLGVKKGVVFNIDRTIKSIKAAIEDTARNCPDGDLNLKNVVVGIAGQHIKSMQTNDSYTRQNKQDTISKEDIAAFVNEIHDMVMPAGEEIITVVPQEFKVGDEHGIKDPVGMAGARLEANFHIITGQVSNVANIYNCVRRAGLEISEVILEPIASAEAVLSEEEKEAGIVLVDIGGGTTDVAIFHDGIIRHTAVIPFGGNIITQDIRTGCRILERHAEKLKVKFGSALASESSEKEVVCIPGLRGQKSKEITVRNLASIIEARMVEIIEKVNNEVQNSGYAKEIIGGIVITGGGSKLKHLTQLFEYLTGMDARIGYPNEHLANTNDESLTSPIFSTGIGLMLKGFEKNARVVEPVAEEEVKKGKFFETVLRGVENLFKD